MNKYPHSIPLSDTQVILLSRLEIQHISSSGDAELFIALKRGTESAIIKKAQDGQCYLQWASPEALALLNLRI